jgi:hypothetical protein
MRTKIMVSASSIVISLLVLSVVFHAHATSPPNLSFPTLRTCTRIGSQITINLQASNVTTIAGWQLNVTFAGAVALKSVTLGSAWTAGGASYYSTTKNSSGVYLYAFTYENGNNLTKTTQFTMLSFVFTVTEKPGIGDFHIVTSTENPLFGTLLANPKAISQPYTTTDGEFDNCINAPGP